MIIVYGVRVYLLGRERTQSEVTSFAPSRRTYDNEVACRHDVALVPDRIILPRGAFGTEEPKNDHCVQHLLFPDRLAEAVNALERRYAPVKIYFDFPAESQSCLATRLHEGGCLNDYANEKLERAIHNTSIPLHQVIGHYMKLHREQFRAHSEFHAPWVSLRIRADLYRDLATTTRWMEAVFDRPCSIAEALSFVMMESLAPRCISVKSPIDSAGGDEWRSIPIQ